MKLIQYIEGSGMGVLVSQGSWTSIAPWRVKSSPVKSNLIAWLQNELRDMAEVRKKAESTGNTYDMAVIDANANGIAWQIETLEDLK